MRECGGRLYCIPKDNPFARSSIARPEIWAWGLRNPWRFSIDEKNDSIWIADVGQNRWEEVNHVSVDDDDQPRDGWNFGSSCREGADLHRVPESAGEAPDPFLDIRCNPRAEYTDPVYSYGLAGNDRCAVMGGVVYRGEIHRLTFADAGPDPGPVPSGPPAGRDRRAGPPGGAVG